MSELVTIFGGGGFLGRYLAQELLRSGARVRLAQRDPLDSFYLKPLAALGQAQAVRADITRPATLARAVEGATAVVNLVGVLSGRFEAVHVEGARHTARAAADAGIDRFVQVSAIGADAEAEAAYTRSKAMGEQAVRTVLPGAVVVRPSILFGPEDAFLNRFAGLIAMLPVLPVVGPSVRFQPAWVVDVARAISRAALEPVHAGRTVELGGPQILTMLELHRWIAQAIGRRPHFVPVPDPAAALLARLGFLPGAPITWDQWLMLQRDNVVSPGAESFATFGIEPSPLEAVAPQWLVRFRRQGRFSLTPA